MYRMRHLIFFYFIFSICTANIFEAQNLDRVRSKIKDPNSISIQRSTIINIDLDGMVDSVIYMTIDRFEDLRRHKETFSYNEDSKVYFVLDEIWEPDSNKWINYSIDTISFDGDGNIVQKLGLLWSEGEWENWWKSEYTFDNQGQKKSWQYYNWLLFSGWSKGVKETYSYDDSGQLILKEAVNSGFNVWRDSLIYNENGLLSIYFAEDWQNDQWVNDWREIYTYNDLNQVAELLRETWQDDQWVNDRREIYNYDLENNLILLEHQLWTTDDIWENYERVNYKYSEDNQLIYGKHELYDGDNWIEENGLLEFYDNNKNHFYYSRQTEIIVHYDGVTAAEDVENIYSFSLKQNYPNPFNPSTVIAYQIPQAQAVDALSRSAGTAGRIEVHVTLIIYDILGREVKTLVNQKQKPGDYEIEFDASILSSGIYFYSLRTDKYIETKRMMLLK